MHTFVRLQLTLVSLGLCLPVAHASDAVSGFVTRAGTPEVYFVNEIEVHCTPGKTQWLLHSPGQLTEGRVECRQWLVGEQLTVNGARDKKSKTVMAETVDVDKPIPLAVNGYAIVDRIVKPVGPAAGTLRADGYLLHITPQTKVSFAEGSSLNMGTLGTNVWVRYTGTLRVDGVVDADTLLFSPNIVTGTEGKLRKKTEFDAASVSEKDRQGDVSKFFLGENAKRIPAYDDEPMQTRISRIGNTLIPQFQRELPDSDPTKIHFRFQLVDQNKLKDGLTLTSGIILVPYQVVDELKSDAQLAAVLAGDIAEVMEEQAVRSVPGNRVRSGTKLAGAAAGFLIPGAGIATSIATGTSASIALHRQQEQSTRTALIWMQDAGYDIHEAPRAWWTLADKKHKPLSEVDMPYRTQYAYQMLGTAYRESR